MSGASETGSFFFPGKKLSVIKAGFGFAGIPVAGGQYLDS